MMESGRLSVIMAGATKRRRLHADSLGSLEKQIVGSYILSLTDSIFSHNIIILFNSNCCEEPSIWARFRWHNRSKMEMFRK